MLMNSETTQREIWRLSDKEIKLEYRQRSRRYKRDPKRKPGDIDVSNNSWPKAPKGTIEEMKNRLFNL
jgi:hypothetical protein